MSTIITATNYVDARLGDIRNNISARTEAVPFLLMPVRIETRFMTLPATSTSATAFSAQTYQTATATTEVVETETLMEDLGKLSLQVLDTEANLGGATLQTLTAETSRIAASFKNLGKITVKEKGWLKQLYNGLNADAQQIKKKAGNAHVEELKKLNDALGQLNTAIQATDHQKVEDLPEVTNLINSMAGLDSRLDTITSSRAKIPYLNIKNKKDLYIYITKVLNRAKGFYTGADKKTAGFKHLDKNQGKRMGELHQNIRAKLAKVKTNLIDIHPDKNWKAFVENIVGKNLNEINQSAERFSGNTLPRLQALPQPKGIDAGHLLMHGMQTMAKIKRFQTRKGKNPKEDVVKKFKKDINPRINKLNEFIKKPINGATEKQIALLKKWYENISKELDTSVKQVQKDQSRGAAQGSASVEAGALFEEDSLRALSSFAGAETGSTNQPEYNMAVTSTITQLWVRIYPDDVFLKTHEEGLTTQERDAGRLFWKTWWASGNDPDLEMAAWRTLCTALGTKRASWVARSLDPRPNTQNSSTLQNKPGALMTDAINFITASNTELKKVNTSVAPGDVFLSLQQKNTFYPVNINFQNISSKLSAFNTVHAYLMEKFKVLLVQTGSLLTTLNEIGLLLTPAQRTQYASILTALSSAITNLANVQSRLSQIQVMDEKTFVDSQVNALIFPVPPAKDKDWTMAPTSDVLPDRFVVLASYAGQFRYIAVGNQIPAGLQLGLNPATFTNGSLFAIDGNGNMAVDPGLKWMFDYPEAVNKGMGITINIDPIYKTWGFDKVIVVGVKNSDAALSAQLLENLLTNHIYSPDGMSFLKAGTPTNNTHLRKSGYALNDDVEQRFDIEIKGVKYNAASGDTFQKHDGKFFTEALGISNSVVQYANNGTNTEIANAFAMNRSLWSATMGHYMEEMWDTLFTYDNIRRTETFFNNYVTGRGIVPAVRIGMQPYGILTTTAFSQLQLYSAMPAVSRSSMASVTPWEAPASLEGPLQTRFEMRMQQLLMMLHNAYTSELQPRVVHSGNLYNSSLGGDPQQRFIKMLGLHATSLEFFYRYSINVAKGPNMTNYATSANFGALDPGGPTGLTFRFKEFAKQGIYFPSFNFADEDPNQNQGWLPFKVIDRMYSRIKEQFEGARLYDARHIDNSYPVAGSLVDIVPASDTAVLSNLTGLSTNYIDWLLNSTANSILGGNEINNPARIPSNTMLFLLLRQSLLQAYQEASLNMLQREGLLAETIRRESGNEARYFYKVVVSGGYKNQYLTKWHYMFKNLADLVTDQALSQSVTGNPFYTYINASPKSVANYLDRVKDANPSMYNTGHVPFFNKVKRVREAIQTLKRVPTAGLETLIGEHMDITSHRLDAWLLGFAHKRLQNQRMWTPNGLYLGAYGYVENLKGDNNKQVVTDTSKLTDFKLAAGKPVYQDPDNDGFIHAPSLGQAIASAVLRNAYKTNTETGDIANRLAVNLSSARVRMALQLIDGIRNGQELGALLGFQFERGLHERYKTIELDKYIQPFRKAFPLQQNVLTTANAAPGYVSLVTDGQAILDLVYTSIQWLGNLAPLFAEMSVASLLKYNAYTYMPQKLKTTIDAALGTDNKSVVYNAIIEEIDRMADAFDALGDLAVSESVYQIVQGNHVRAAAVLTALADGKSLPDPQIIETHRNGTVVTQRVLLNFISVNANTVPAGWPVKNSVRYAAEPSFNNWLGQTIGDAAKWKYVLTRTDAQNQVTKTSFSLAALEWQPLDVLELPGGEEELKDILINIYRKNSNDYTSVITLDTKEREAAWLADEKTISELFLLLKHIRNMLSNARVAGLSDLKTAEDASVSTTNPGAHNVNEYQLRITGALQALNTFIQQVSGLPFVTQVTSGTKAVADVVLTETDFGTILTHLNRAVLLALPNAFSVNLVQQDTPQKRATAALQHLLNILKQAQSKYQVANGLAGNISSAPTSKVKVEKLSELAKAVLGKSFLAIPQYGVAGTEPISAQLALPAAQAITRQGGLAAVEDWLQNIGRVRKRLYDTQMYLQMADVYDLPVASVNPVQLPYNPNDYWLGIEYPSTYVPEGDKVSLVLLNDSVFRTAGAVGYASLVVDEWVEIIPNKEVTSGIVFNYNQPNAAAPQAMLLAVTPNVNNRWQWDDLVHTIIDTMVLAKNRAIEPDHIESSFLSHVLPTTVSEVVPPQVQNEGHNPLGVQVVMDFADVKPKTV